MVFSNIIAVIIESTYPDKGVYD